MELVLSFVSKTYAINIPYINPKRINIDTYVLHSIVYDEC